MSSLLDPSVLSAGLIAQADSILRAQGLALSPEQRAALELALSAVLARDMSHVQQQVGEWQAATFGDDRSDAAVRAIQKKMEHEDHELMLALVGAGYKYSAEIEGELADRQILTFGMATKLGIDIYAAMTAKMAINKARRWPALDQQAPGQPVRHLDE